VAVGFIEWVGATVGILLLLLLPLPAAESKVIYRAVTSRYKTTVSEKATTAKRCNQRIADVRQQGHLVSHIPNNILQC
jgi:hypothetical protein